MGGFDPDTNPALGTGMHMLSRPHVQHREEDRRGSTVDESAEAQDPIGQGGMHASQLQALREVLSDSE